LSVEKGGSRHLIHVKEAHLRDDEKHTVLGAILHENWEVTILLNLDIGRPLDLLLTWSWVANFHDMQLLGLLSSLLLTEAKQGILVARRVRDRHVGESGCKTFKDLLLPFLSEEKLHVATDLVVSSLIDSNEVAPFFGGVNSIAHNLSISKFSFLIEDLGRGSLVLDVTVVDRCLSNDGKF